MQKYPKVLILCERFDDSTGMGVTLTNLFKEWPKEKLALAGFKIDRGLCEKIRPCSSYFALDGRFEPASSNKRNSTRRRSRFRNLLKAAYRKLGVSDYRDITVTEDLKKFIADYKPEIIFSALGDLRRIRFTEQLADAFPEVKLALYIVDDWPDSRFDGRWMENIWRRVYNKATKHIVNRSEIRLSICQKMSEVYLERYGKQFDAFHNPVDIEYWQKIKPRSLYAKDTFSIAYVGKINRDTERQLTALAKSVEDLNKEGIKVKFDIYTPSSIPQELKEYKNSEVKVAVPNSEVAAILKSYSLLFLTLGFSRETIKYVKLSMPTKLTEYLASGTPILLYTPEGIALTEYLKSNKAAIICSNEGNLYTTLKDIISDNSLLENTIANALILAQKHDAPVVREEFLNVLNQ